MVIPAPTKVPYFVWDSGYPWKNVCLFGHDPLGIISKIESGEKIFQVVPGLLEKLGGISDVRKNFPYGEFETREEIRFDGRIFRELQNPVRVGKLFVPHYKIIGRSEVEDKLNGVGVERNVNYGGYEILLSKHPEASGFYLKGLTWEPIDEERTFVLDKKHFE